MWGWPLPGFILGQENELINALLQMLWCIPVLFIDRKYFIHGVRNLLSGAPNMDSLIAVAAVHRLSMVCIPYLAWRMPLAITVLICYQLCRCFIFEASAVIWRL